MSKIILVDDNDLVREIGLRLLQSQGHTVQPACSGSEALGLLKGEEGFDCLITDIVMPGGMNGVELANAARQYDPELKIVLVTGNIDSDIVDTASLTESYTVLQKPYRKQQLLQLFAECQGAEPTRIAAFSGRARCL